jgi:hypothetical protein
VNGLQVMLLTAPAAGEGLASTNRLVSTTVTIANAPIRPGVRAISARYTPLLGPRPRPQVRSAAMKLLRRVFAVLLMAGAAAAAIRVKGRGGTPPEHGGWRPLELPDNTRP